MAKEETTPQGNEHLDYTTKPAKDGSFSIGTLENHVNVHENAPVVDDVDEAPVAEEEVAEAPVEEPTTDK